MKKGSKSFGKCCPSTNESTLIRELKLTKEESSPLEMGNDSFIFERGFKYFSMKYSSFFL